MIWESVIGLEVHVQLQTQSKIFSGASTSFGSEPNCQACEIDIALPGVLPVMNRRAALMAVKFGLATNATVNRYSVFARKNYFYPDLPKGYQISQYELPVVSGGHIEIDVELGSRRKIGITRAHLEEDAGKLLHGDSPGLSGIDFNRAGTPLLEVVSEPDLHSPSEAISYLKKLHTLVRYLEICDGNMQEGSFRCDANVSVRKTSDASLGARCELKNLNSFRFIEKGLQFEINRQIELIEDGGKVIQETRMYDPTTDRTRPMRIKEDAHDYRYFPDPDLPPLVIDDALLEEAQSSLPELPDARRDRFINEYELSDNAATQLTSEREIADYFEDAVLASRGDSQTTANWVNSELMRWLNRESLNITDSRVSPRMLGELVVRINDQTVSGKSGKQVFQAMWNGEGSVDDIIKTYGLRKITDTDLIEQTVIEVLLKFPEQSAQFRSGQEKVLSFLVGQVMKATGGKADPKVVSDTLQRKLWA